MARSLTGDALTDALVPVAQQLVGAVREDSRAGVEAALQQARQAVDAVVDGADSELAVRALAVLCAAMVPDDQAPTALLRWTTQAQEYRRLVEAGVSPEVAVVLAQRET